MRRNLIAVTLVLAGCGTTPGPEAYQRDGRQYGVTEGTFRGRWWNHYERGRSFLDGGFLDEAVSDLEVALSLRAEDQRWARTYGLHFIPEYFPNRELGVALFRQGRLDEAARRLEISLAQEPSALAAHFLNQVRAAQVRQQGGDTQPPRLSANFDPELGVITVQASDDTFVVSVRVDGTPHLFDEAVPELRFAQRAPAFSAVRDILVQAEDIAGNLSEIMVRMERDADGPAIAWVDDASGLARDPSGIEEITMDGQRLELEQLDADTVRFSLPAGMQRDTSARLVASDARGNRTEVSAVAREHLARAGRAWLLAGQLDNAWIAGLMQRAAQSAAGPEARLRLTNLADGQRYLMDEIVVSVEASDPDGVSTVVLDGAPMDSLLPGATTQHLSRRVPLSGMGEHTITAVMTDALGNTTETRVTVFREPTAVELPDAQLRVALLGSLWEGAGQRVEGESAYVAEELARALFERGRFDLVSRDALPRVLEEQELRAVLGSRDLEDGLRTFVPADLFAVGKVRRTGEAMEIVLQAVSTETSSILAYADVAGRAETLDDLRALTRDLALRFEQEFPKVRGEVVQAGESQCHVTLNASDRIRNELPCVIYRLGDPIVHPVTGTVLGQPTEILARGRLDEVRAQMSRVALSPGGAPVQVNDHVATR